MAPSADVGVSWHPNGRQDIYRHAIRLRTARRHWPQGTAVRVVDDDIL